jgi:hypothetical protein
MHALFGFLILGGVGAFVVFALRQSTGVRRSGRRDDGTAWPMAGGGSDSGASHDSGGGFGHGS